jgi:hypothetical protein
MTRTSGPYRRKPKPEQEAKPVPRDEWAQLGEAHLLLFRARWGK